jgi:hypothetical protein
MTAVAYEYRPTWLILSGQMHGFISGEAGPSGLLSAPSHPLCPSLVIEVGESVATTQVELLVSDDSDPLTVEDWADLWVQLTRNGCVCTLTTSAEQAAGAKSPELIIGLILSTVTTRLAPVLLRFYDSRRKGRIKVRKGDQEWILEGLTAAEAERLLSGIADALSGQAGTEIGNGG